MIVGSRYSVLWSDILGRIRPAFHLSRCLTPWGHFLSGFTGCNQSVGVHVLEGDALQFTQIAGTRMARNSPSMELEVAVLKTLGAITRCRIEGAQPILLADPQPMARFEARYLR